MQGLQAEPVRRKYSVERCSWRFLGNGNAHDKGMVCSVREIYEEFKMYMQAGYIDEMDINGLREIASGNFAEGGMTDEDIALASEIGEERWAEFADKLADELEEVLK